MAVVKCEHGHYYNDAQYEECPVCWEMDFGDGEERQEAEADAGLLAVAFRMGAESE